MTAFSADWLTLREGLDAASRAAVLNRRLADFFSATCPDGPISITDLASGTGANLRYLAPALGGRQHWRITDNDPALLDAMRLRMTQWAAADGLNLSGHGQAHDDEVSGHGQAHDDDDGASGHGQAHSDTAGDGPGDGQALSIRGAAFECTLRVEQTDLASALQALDLPEGSLVTASALLDLVSEAWLLSLARRCLGARAPVLFALSYDGRIEFDPGDPRDERVRELVNRHQRTDKGFGPALGPAAAERSQQAFEALGYRVDCEPSDWHIGPADRRVQETLIAGWFAAALEIAPEEAERLGRWRDARRALIADGRSSLVVGHRDLLGLPPG